MPSQKNIVKGFSDALNGVAGVCLLAMTGLTCLDVILRLFRRPILGTYELVQFLGAAVAAFAMAHTTYQRGHVAVEVLVIRLSPGLQKIIYFAVQCLSLFLFAVLAYECVIYGNDFRTSGEVSMTLRIPFYPILYGISFASAGVCAVVLAELYQVFIKGKPPWFRWE